MKGVGPDRDEASPPTSAVPTLAMIVATASGRASREASSWLRRRLEIRWRFKPRRRRMRSRPSPT